MMVHDGFIDVPVVMITTVAKGSSTQGFRRREELRIRLCFGVGVGCHSGDFLR